MVVVACTLLYINTTATTISGIQGHGLLSRNVVAAPAHRTALHVDQLSPVGQIAQSISYLPFRGLRKQPQGISYLQRPLLPGQMEERFSQGLCPFGLGGGFVPLLLLGLLAMACHPQPMERFRRHPSDERPATRAFG